MESRKNSPRLLFLGCFFAFSWLATFSVAIMNGDDVVHYASSLQSSLVPRFHESWTPNRIVDTYGRSILSSIFSFLYFSMNGIFKISFMSLYTLLSASLFAVFSTIVLSYLLRTISNDSKNKVFSFSFSLLMAGLVFVVFPWKNQVHFICYQIPAFLTFILLKATTDIKSEQPGMEKISGLLLLSYICSFSLEAFAATIFAFNALLLVIHLRQENGSMLHRNTRAGIQLQVILANLFFSLLALAITILFSERAKITVDTNHLEGFTLRPISKFVPAILAFAFLVWSGLVNWRQRRSPANARSTGQVFFCVQLGLIVLAVTFLISLKTNANYLSIGEYPWGDLMLIGKIAVLYLSGLVVLRFASRLPRAQPLLTLLLVFAFSKLLHTSLKQIEKESLFSREIESLYSTVILGERSSFKTGLDLDAIPMPTRPLPTATSPEWFIKGYGTVFQKFHGVKTAPVFE